MRTGKWVKKSFRRFGTICFQVILIFSFAQLLLKRVWMCLIVIRLLLKMQTEWALRSCIKSGAELAGHQGARMHILHLQEAKNLLILQQGDLKPLGNIRNLAPVSKLQCEIWKSEAQVHFSATGSMGIWKLSAMICI